MLFRFHILITHLERVWGKKNTKKNQQKPKPNKTHIQGQEKNIFSWKGGTILWPCTSQSHCLFLCTDAGHGPDTRRERPGGQMHQEVCEARPSAGVNSDLTLTARGTTRAALSAHHLWASSYCFVNFSCSQGAVYRTTVDWSLISQTLRKQKERGRNPTSNCPKQPEQKQSSPSLQHLEELIVTADPNYYDNNAATLIAL